jgi:hypothetical protein
MKAATIELEEKVDELLVCLETDLRHLRESLSDLNELRSLVIKRDDPALEKLLENIQAKAGRYADHESHRQSMRKELADVLCCDFEQMTLSALRAYLPQGKSQQVAQMQRQLRELTAELKKEHLRTTLLLSECARFNSLLLRSIFDLSQTGAVYYDSSGATRRQTDTALMDLQF